MIKKKKKKIRDVNAIIFLVHKCQNAFMFLFFSSACPTRLSLLINEKADFCWLKRQAHLRALTMCMCELDPTVALWLCRLCSWLPGWELGMADVMLRYATVKVT